MNEDYQPGTIRQALEELNQFRREWREQHGEIPHFKRRHEWSNPRRLTKGTKAEYMQAKKAGRAK